MRVSGGRRQKGARLLTPFVGRDDDLAILTRSSERALAGEGQFVLIAGEPGIGKSRLVEEFRGRLADKPHSWIEWNSSQLLQNTPLHPLVGWGRARFGGPEAAPEQRLAELESLLDAVRLDAAKYAPLLAPMVGIPLPPERLPRLSPEETRRSQTAAMVDWAIAGARNQPVVLVFEDLQWFDPTSIDLVHALSDQVAAAPILLLATARPEFRPPWDLKGRHRVISLAPLDETQVQRMIAELATAPHAVGGGDEARGRARGRRPAVRRGGDAPHSRARRAAGGAGDSPDPAPVAGGAPRPAGIGARNRADRRGLGAKLLLRAPARRCVSRRARAEETRPSLARIRAGYSGRCRPSLRRWRPAGGDLSLQACADSGRRVRQPVEKPSSGAPPARGRGAHRGRFGAGGDRPSFHGGGRQDLGGRMVGQCGRGGSAPFGVQGGDGASRQGDRSRRRSGPGRLPLMRPETRLFPAGASSCTPTTVTRRCG